MFKLLFLKSYAGLKKKVVSMGYCPLDIVLGAVVSM